MMRPHCIAVPAGICQENKINLKSVRPDPPGHRQTIILLPLAGTIPQALEGPLPLRGSIPA